MRRSSTSIANQLTIGSCILISACIFLAPSAKSDTLGDSSFAAVDSTIADASPTDTVLYDPGDILDRFSAVNNPTNFETRRTQPPTVALLKSMVVPGFGQVGNKRYFKAALFFGLDAWFLSSAIKYRQDARDFRSKFESVDGDDDASVALRRDYYNQYQDNRDQRNKYTWFAVIVTFVSMFDAYADAHLSGFPIAQDDNVRISLQTISRDETVIAAIQFEF